MTSSVTSQDDVIFRRRASPEPETCGAGTGNPLPEPEPEPEAETGSDVIKPEVGPGYPDAKHDMSQPKYRFVNKFNVICKFVIEMLKRSSLRLKPSQKIDANKNCE